LRAETALTGCFPFLNPPARSGLLPSHPKEWPLRSESSMMPGMWICADCNQLVPNPVNRKCPNGHAMADLLILGATVENTFGKSFLRAFLIALGIAALIILSRFFLPEKTVGHILGMALVFMTAVGVVALLRALKWKRQHGPVSRLVPRALGTGLGCILAGGGLLAIGFVLGMIN
jgi:hypothetical protein